MQRIMVILPAYNESQTLPSLLQRIDDVKINSGLQIEVLVINDGSTDNTSELAKNFKAKSVLIKVFDVIPNKGLANGMRTGLTMAAEQLSPNDIVIAMDADDSHQPGLMVRMIQQINEGSDIVIASRYQKGARIVGLSRFREYLSVGAGLLYRIFIGIRGVKDYTCGYRAYRISLIQQALKHYKESFIEQQGFGCMAEILIKLKKFNPVVHELPMILRYDFKLSDSKMQLSKTIKQSISLILKSR
jgi:dolichol-phosphate mannosyltransferase